MKLLRIKQNNKIKPSIIDKDNYYRDLTDFISDWDNNSITSNNIDYLYKIDLKKFPKIEKNFTIAPCIANVGKFVCIGLNYIDHVEEMGMEKPKEPTIFMKATSSISGPNDNIIIPKNSSQLDWEIELGVIISKKGKNIKENLVDKYIAGYCIVNDISERSFQLERNGQWVKGKSCDTFGPIGPYIVTQHEITNVQELNLWLKVNENIMQNSSTSKMIYNVNYLISYISNFMTLHPGDIIATGTPSGVGIGKKPKVFLKKNDKISCGINGLGEQNYKVV